MYLTICVAKIYLKYCCFSETTFWLHKNSLDSGQPASEEAGLSGSTLFFKQFMHNLEISGKLVDLRTTCIHLLK